MRSGDSLSWAGRPRSLAPLCHLKGIADFNEVERCEPLKLRHTGFTDSVYKYDRALKKLKQINSPETNSGTLLEASVNHLQNSKCP